MRDNPTYLYERVRIYGDPAAGGAEAKQALRKRTLASDQ